MGMDMRQTIESGDTALGIELGSTRIKAVLITGGGEPIASGSHEWENQLVNGVWTYSLDDVWAGMRACYQDLKRDVRAKCGATLTKVGAIGISAMMHGYLAFDSEGRLLVPFRTWRNTSTAQASEQLGALFGFNIPQRWSVAHLYQAILNGEEHVGQVAFSTTLAGYVHYMLTGERVLGVNDASGMFPIDSVNGGFNQAMVRQFDELVAPKGYPWTLNAIFPRVLSAGEAAGALTKEGALLLDADGELAPGVPFCPPEGDAGTGMVATNAVAARTGNISAGTSVFAMIVLEKDLSRVHPEIDIVTTPTGKPVAMVHCNNCTSDLNAWVSLFGEFAEAMGIAPDMNLLFGTLYRKALEGDADCGGLLAYNFLSGEHIVGMEAGRPLFVRTPGSSFNLANFMRTHLYAALSTLKIGMEILLGEEKVAIDQIFGHGGLFKTKGVAQKIMAAAIRTPVSVMQTASEGGAWGIALLAAYLKDQRGETLEAYLGEQVFSGMAGETMAPDEADIAGFDKFIARFQAGLAIERAAVDTMK